MNIAIVRDSSRTPQRHQDSPVAPSEFASTHRRHDRGPDCIANSRIQLGSFPRIRLPGFARISVLLGLSTLLSPVQYANAQICNTSLADDIFFDERCVRIGDNVHFSVHLAADITTCLLDGGTNWVIMPDGTVHTIVVNYARFNCGFVFTIDCPGGAGCDGDIPTEIGPSGFLRFKYGPVQAADVGRTLPMYTTGRGSVFTAQVGLPLAGKIWAGTISDARTTDCNDPNTHDKATAQGISHAAVETGDLSLTTIVNPRLEDTNFVFDFTMHTPYSYRVQFTDALSPTNWQTLTNIPGDCTVATIRDSITNAQRFYRLLVQ